MIPFRQNSSCAEQACVFCKGPTGKYSRILTFFAREKKTDEHKLRPPSCAEQACIFCKGPKGKYSRILTFFTRQKKTDERKLRPPPSQSEIRQVG